LALANTVGVRPGLCGKLTLATFSSAAGENLKL